MGANVSKVDNDMLNRTVTRTAINVLNENNMVTNNRITNTQDMEFNIHVGGSMTKCEHNYQQNMIIENKVYSKMDAKATNDLETELKNTFKETIKNDVELKNKGINIGQVNISEVDNKTVNETITDLSKNIATKLSSEVNNAIDNSQKMKNTLWIGGDLDCSETGGILATQNINLQNVVENTMKSDTVTKVLDRITVETSSSKDTTVKATNEGISLLGLLLAIFLPIIILGIIVFIVKKMLGVSFFTALWYVFIWPFVMMWRGLVWLVNKARGKKSQFGRRRKVVRKATIKRRSYR